MAIDVNRLSTGNEYVSIPEIYTSNGGVGCIGFVHNAFRASIELRGSAEIPLLKPVVQVDGEELFEAGVKHDLVSFWIPSFEAASPRIKATSAVFSPLGRRGFVCALTIHNTSDSELTLKAGWKGCWESSYHTANLSRQISGNKFASISSWKPGVPVIEFRGHAPLFAMALVSRDCVPATITAPNQSATSTGESLSTEAGNPVHYELVSDYALKPGERLDLPIYVGVGLEEVSAIASAEELRLQGWQAMLANLRNWLDRHTIECDEPYFKHMMNVNSFYNYFFSQATTLDTEELVLTSARSSQNDWCASYRDRDAMRWSLPAVLQIDWTQARSMLIYAFTTQHSNVGIHSRFIDGKVLEPGFQLDAMCAPIRALDVYVEVTGDMSVLFDRRVQAGVNTIQQILAAQRHPEVALFETLLLPSGKASTYPYVCFSNMLVWRSLLDIARIYDRIRDIDRAEEAGKLAAVVKSAVMSHFVVEGPFGKMYACEVDLKGNSLIGDDPMGSLQLLCYFGFCNPNDQAYKNTVNWIHSEHNTLSGKETEFEAPTDQDDAGPSVISIITDLLTGRAGQALDFLRRAKLDQGIACSTVDTDAGEGLSGKAFASGAGYLALGLRNALNAVSPQTALIEQKKRPSEALYHPPPETSHDTRKARM